jgi:hypothetical protein
VLHRSSPRFQHLRDHLVHPHGVCDLRKEIKTIHLLPDAKEDYVLNGMTPAYARKLPDRTAS